MIFIYKKWDSFCRKLSESEIVSVPAKEITRDTKIYTVLKHDVETDVSRALSIARIEHKHGHRGSYYVQAYLLSDEKNISMLKEIQGMGHEVSYHYDVMDSCKGDIKQAIAEFETNKNLFEENGFKLKTLCQHGNPIVERIGYTSNRDFFRNEKVQELYPELSDVMVDFKTKHETEYLYFSDAGRHFQLIYDPLNNDIIKSDDKNVLYKNTDELFAALDRDGGNIISIHPHRWTASALKYVLKACLFKTIKAVAKVLIKIPLMKKIMSKYYYLAKKI